MARFLVPPPPYTSTPYGLLDAATVVDSPEAHIWQAGIEWEPACYGPAGVLAEGGCPEVAPGDPPPAHVPYDKTEAAYRLTVGDDKGFADGLPFTTWTRYECSLVGRSLDEHRARAVEVFSRGDTRTIESVVERGTPSSDGSLAAPGRLLDASLAGSSDGGNDPLPLAEAIAVAEWQGAWLLGQTGVIHMPRDVALLALSEGVLVTDRGRLRTALGTPVAAGSGYLGSGPGGMIAGVAAIYVTGPVVVYRDTPQVVGETTDGIDTSVNDVALIVERQVIVAWECGALRVDAIRPTILPPEEPDTEPEP